MPTKNENDVNDDYDEESQQLCIADDDDLYATACPKSPVQSIGSPTLLSNLNNESSTLHSTWKVKDIPLETIPTSPLSNNNFMDNDFENLQENFIKNITSTTNTNFLVNIENKVAGTVADSSTKEVESLVSAIIGDATVDSTTNIDSNNELNGKCNFFYNCFFNNINFYIFITKLKLKRRIQS